MYTRASLTDILARKSERVGQVGEDVRVAVGSMEFKLNASQLTAFDINEPCCRMQRSTYRIRPELSACATCSQLYLRIDSNAQGSVRHGDESCVLHNTNYEAFDPPCVS